MQDRKPAQSSKSYSRGFDIQVAIPPLDQIVWELIDSIENDQLTVFDAHDENALIETATTDSPVDLFGRAKTPIIIKEWLCVSCQVIRWEIGDELHDPRNLAMYSHNAPRVMYPKGAMYLPPGPTAFFGDIVIRECFSNPQDLDKLSFIIAHEMKHAIDMLRMLVPAIQDWPAFWENVLHGGCCVDLALSFQQYQALFLDDYGSPNELAAVAEYWPSKAEKWFKAFRG